MVLKARIEHGKIIATAPDGYADGTEIDIEIVDLLGMNADELAELDEAIDEADRDFAAGRFIGATELIAKLEAAHR